MVKREVLIEMNCGKWFIAKITPERGLHGHEMVTHDQAFNWMLENDEMGRAAMHFPKRMTVITVLQDRRMPNKKDQRGER